MYYCTEEVQYCRAVSQIKVSGLGLQEVLSYPEAMSGPLGEASMKYSFGLRPAVATTSWEFPSFLLERTREGLPSHSVIQRSNTGICCCTTDYPSHSIIKALNGPYQKSWQSIVVIHWLAKNPLIWHNFIFLRAIPNTRGFGNHTIGSQDTTMKCGVSQMGGFCLI